jgi:hypothetical protein
VRGGVEANSEQSESMGLQIRRGCAFLHNSLNSLQVWLRLHSEGEKAVEVTITRSGAEHVFGNFEFGSGNYYSQVSLQVWLRV